MLTSALGTGDGLASATNRILGILAPLIKIATTRGETTAANTNASVASESASSLN